MTDPEITSIKSFPTIDYAIDSPEGGKIINEAVARKLKEWFSNCKCKFPLESAHHNCPGEFGNCHHPVNCNLPDYCHDIKAAWEIVESITARPINGSFDLDWWAGEQVWVACCMDSDQRFIEEKAAAAPMAICQAFLRLYQIKENRGSANETPKGVAP